jgi:glycosyltransferase involved in cell wall biosynthesis
MATDLQLKGAQLLPISRSRAPQAHVLAVLPAVTPSTVLGVIKPIKQLHRDAKIYAVQTLEYLVTRQQVQQADVVVFCRNTEPAHRQALDWALEAGKPIIYDLDDDLLDLPMDLAEARYHRRPEYKEQLRRYLESADLVRTYSRRLRTKVDAINPRVRQVAGPVDWRMVPAAPVPRTHDAEQKVQFVYATSRVEDRLFNLFLEDVQELLRAYPNRAQLSIWGFRAKELESHPAVRFLKYESDYDRFFRRFARSGFDVGLAPLPNEDFYLSKSNNKFREYAACRIAGIYSNVPVYSECVEDGLTGLLVENQRGAWFEALERLLLNHDLLHQIQERAQQYAREQYSQDSFCGVWLEQIQSVMAAKEPCCVAPGRTDESRVEVAATVGKSNRAESSETPLKAARRLLRVMQRFVVNSRARGMWRTLSMVRWALNDLTLLFRN